MKLSEDQIMAELTTLHDWHRDDRKWIVRKYRFKTFKQAVGFVCELAEAAETMNHHPFITIDFRLVTLRLTTWNAGGLTSVDFQAARAFDKLYSGEE